MSKITVEATKSALFHAQVPKITDTYMPVPNRVLVEALYERLDKKNMKVVTERYDHNRELTQMFGVVGIDVGDTEQRMSIGFRNSYDKSLAVGLVAGGMVIVCSNLCFSGEIKLLRKHTAGVFNDLNTLIDNVIEYATEEYEIIKKDSDLFKQVECNKTLMAELTGKMFIEEDLLTTTQINIIKKEIKFSEHFHGESLWDFYNHTTEALKKAHPLHVMQKHINTHSFLKKEFSLV